MAMLRKIKQKSPDYCISLEPSDLKDMGVKVGDEIDIQLLIDYRKLWNTMDNKFRDMKNGE